MKRHIYVHVGIEPWTFVQNLGEAVFIPAGCAHQVRNLKVCWSRWSRNQLKIYFLFYFIFFKKRSGCKRLTYLKFNYVNLLFRAVLFEGCTWFRFTGKCQWVHQIDWWIPITSTWSQSEGRQTWGWFFVSHARFFFFFSHSVIVMISCWYTTIDLWFFYEFCIDASLMCDVFQVKKITLYALQEVMKDLKDRKQHRR